MVTIDAMGCQRDIAQKIGEQGADYVLALKGNQPTLEQAVERFFMTGPEAEAHCRQRDYQEHTEQGHGRVETRRAWISADLDAELRAAAWPGLQSIAMGEATRTGGEKTLLGVGILCGQRQFNYPSQCVFLSSVRPGLRFKAAPREAALID
jgi:hypothetical protein